MDLQDLEREVENLRQSRHSTDGALHVLQAELKSISGKLDAIHLSLKEDLHDLHERVQGIEKRTSLAELRLARLQGAGAALALGLPFAAAAVDRLL